MRTFLITLCAVFSSLTCSAQSFNVKDLIGTKWEQIQSDENKVIRIEFTADKIIRTFSYKIIWKTVTLEDRYYISTSVPLKFEEKNVGKDTSGKYLVYINKRNYVNYQTIMELTDTTLRLYQRAIPEAVGGFEHTDTYKRIK